MKILAYNIFPICCILCSTYLISSGLGNWGWFFVAGVFTAAIPSGGE
jgi:hypothetical protein